MVLGATLPTVIVGLTANDYLMDHSFPKQLRELQTTSLENMLGVNIKFSRLIFQVVRYYDI